MEVNRIEYREGEVLVEAEPMLFSSLYAVGQGVVVNFVHYRVSSVEVVDGVQRVGVVRDETCSSCGGMKGSRVPRFRCVCDSPKRGTMTSDPGCGQFWYYDSLARHTWAPTGYVVTVWFA